MTATNSPLHILVSYYHTYFDNGVKEPKQVYLDEFLFSKEHLIKPTERAIRTAEFIMRKSNSLPKDYSVREFMLKPLSEKLSIIRSTKDKSEKDKLKKLLPAVTPSALFHGRRHKASTEFIPTGFLVLDLDGVDVEEIKDKIAQYSDKILYCGLSVSGKGLFIIIKIAHPEKHLQHFACAKAGLEADMHIRVDQLPDLTRLRGYAHDPEGFYNPNALVYEGLIEVKETDTINFSDLPELAPTTEFDKPEYCELIIEAVKKKGYCVQNYVYDTIFRCVDRAKKYGLSDAYIHNYFYRHYLTSGKVQSDSEKYNYEYYEQAFAHGLKYKDTHNKLRFHQKRQLQHSDKPDKVISVKGKVGSDPEAVKSVVDFISDSHRTIIDLRTGGGKNYLLIKKIVPTSPYRFLITVPLKMQTAQIREEYTGWVDYCIDGESGADDKIKAKNAKLVVCTIDQLPHFTDCGFDYLIIDEIHDLTDSVSYRYKAISQVYNSFDCFPKGVIGLSGTAPYDLQHLGFKVLQIKTNMPDTVKIHRRDYDESSETYHKVNIALEHIQHFDFSADRKHIIEIKSQAMLKRLKKLVVKIGLLTEDQVGLLYSSSAVESSSLYKSIVDSRQIPEEYKLILCTNVLNMGVNILNKDTELTAFDLTQNELVQFVNRLRKIENIKFTSFKKKKPGTPIGENPFKRKLQVVNDYCKELNEGLDLEEEKDMLRREREATGASIDFAKLYKFTSTHGYVPDIPKILFHCKQLNDNCRSTDEFYAQICERYEYIGVVDQADVHQSGKFEEIIEQQYEVEKAKKAETEKTIFDLMRDNLSPFLEAVYFLTKDTDLKKLIAANVCGKGYIKGQSLASIEMQARNSRLFIDNEREVEKAAKNYFYLKSIQVPDGNLIDCLQMNHSRFSDFKKSIILFIKLFRRDEAKVKISSSTKRELELLDKFYKVIDDLPGKECELKELLKKVNKGRHKATVLTEYTLKQLISFTYETGKTRTLTEGKKSTRYFFKSKKTLDTLLKFSKINPSEFKKVLSDNYYNILNDRDLEAILLDTSTSYNIRKENFGKCPVDDTIEPVESVDEILAAIHAKYSPPLLAGYGTGV